MLYPANVHMRVPPALCPSARSGKFSGSLLSSPPRPFRSLRLRVARAGARGGPAPPRKRLEARLGQIGTLPPRVGSRSTALRHVVESRLSFLHVGISSERSALFLSVRPPTPARRSASSSDRAALERLCRSSRHGAVAARMAAWNRQGCSVRRHAGYRRRGQGGRSA